jgi:hypothetical protein
MDSSDDHAPGAPDSAWCVYCSNSDGSLQRFEEVLERLTQFMMDEHGVGRGRGVVGARELMREMPAWRQHPGLADPIA